jgi:methylmalonyl-CoA/ethylmalonyl-CoA epimerase
MVTKIDHLGILVDDIDDNRTLFELLDLTIGAIEHVPAFGVDIAFIRVGQSLVELVEPVDRNSAVAGDLDGTDQSALLHHVAYRVEDIETRLQNLRASGVTLADEEPRTGAGGAKVAFLDRRAANGVRIELVEREVDVTLA